MVNALTFYRDLLVKHNFSLRCNFKCVRERFKTGNAAYNLNGIWDGKEFYKALGENLGVAPLPTLNGTKIVSPFSTHVISFPNNSINGKHQAVLTKLVDYLQSPPIQEQIWTKIGAIPVEPSAFENAQANAQGYLKNSLLLLANTKPLPADLAMSFVWDAMRKGMIRYHEGGMNAKETAAYMQQLIERNDTPVN